MIDRVIGIISLKTDVYEEVEHDQGALPQAATIVIAVALLSAIGKGIGDPDQVGFLTAFIGQFLGTLIGWVLWAYVTLYVGTRLFKGQADMGEMLRVLGFAHVPMVLQIGYMIPSLGGAMLAMVGALWFLVTSFIAVRQGLDIGNFQTLVTIIISVILYVIMLMGFAMLAGIVLAAVVGVAG